MMRPHLPAVPTKQLFAGHSVWTPSLFSPVWGRAGSGTTYVPKPLSGTWRRDRKGG